MSSVIKQMYKHTHTHIKNKIKLNNDIQNTIKQQQLKMKLKFFLGINRFTILLILRNNKTKINQY
jgi:hypothetical protein